MDGGRHGPMQEAMDAAQRRAFAKSAAGEALTPQEKQLVDDLWNSDPAKASEYWAAGEFLDTEVPGASSLDGGGFDGTMKSEAAASPTGQRTPFDYLQDGKGWEEEAASFSDEIVKVENEAAFETGKLIAKEEGILVGISSGAALWAGIEEAKKPENKGKTIVVLLPDSGDRYYSTPLFTE